jgi:class 3 adenylate cyclase/tetratricopeptide (TPR) repeat protein/tRNA A-37 threonylcarbamoyl transferase component Bud32
MTLHFGAYEVLEEIGKGGMATVYRARQASVDRDVAIKIIKGSIKDDHDAVQRFQREAKVIARLEHPHILPIYDFDGAHEPPYIVMRYLDGGTLKDVMKQGLLPLPEVAYLMQQIASALDYAHKQGIVHRDIKPSNIMIDREGNAFVSDLGIARITGGGDAQRKGITMSGAIIGTPEYMSPEQAMGLTDVDYRADIYSLGVMLYEMLTGDLPFLADTTMGTLLKHIQSPIPHVRDHNPDLPQAIEEIIETALAKEPDDRFSSAGELARQLIHMSGSTMTVAPVRLQAATAESIVIRAVKVQGAKTGDKASEVSTSSRTTPTEQQRQVTVVHINLADFEELLMDAAPEEAGRTLAALLDQFQKIIERGGGQVRERTATTLQALWGVTEVHETDPESAINTALAVRDTAQKLTAKWLEKDEGMPIQIGIDTGAVLIQSDPNGTSTTSGQPITFATRIERAAPAGSILISHDTYRHVTGIYDVLQETPVRVRGRTEPIPVYVVQSARPRAFRLQSRGVEGIETKMIGRDGELKLLQDAMMLCIEDSETQMVTVTAEAGVGKSRLLFEFSRWLDIIDQHIKFFEGRATQQTTNLPYSLIRSLFSYRFEILDSDTPEVMREKFTKGIAVFLGTNTEDKAAFIGQLVGFDFSEHPAVKPVLSSADAFQRQAVEHLNTFFRSITKEIPAIIELEDIHWADMHSLDLIDHLVKENRELPLMVICMARPELNERRRGWGEGQDFHHRIDLKPLSKLDTRRLVREVLQKVDDIPAEIRDLIVERADGNPFYIEELVKILIEDGVIVKGETDDARWRVLPERLADLRVPPTLTGVLQARLDTLEPSARLLLGRAAVVGRIFWVSAIEALEAADGFHIERQERLLDDLRRREMIYLREKSDFAGTQEYVIKHAILRDVIYESLLKRQQRSYHAAVAEWLIKASAERADEYTGLIAEHYEKAGEPTKAAGYLFNAGQQAYQVSAYLEALASLNHALSILPTEGEDAQRMRIKVNLLVGEIYDAAGRYNELQNLLEPTLTLARSLNDPKALADTLGQLGRFVGVRRGNYAEGETYLLEAETLARAADALPTLMFVLRQLGNLYLVMENKIQLALAPLEESLRIARSMGNEFGAASTLNSIGNIHGALFQNPQAIAAYDEAISIGQRIGDLRVVAFAIGNKGNCFIVEKNFEEALRANEEALNLSQKIGLDTTINRMNIAQLGVLLGHSSEMIEEHLQVALRQSLADDYFPMVVTGVENYGLFYGREGQYARALEYLGLALASDTLEPTERPLFIDPAIDRIRQHVSEDEVQAGLARGAKLDAYEVARSLLKS